MNSDYDGYDSVELDFSDQTETGRTLLPSGVYPARVVDVKKYTSRTTGNDYWRVAYQIVDPDYDDVRVWDNLMFNGGAKRFGFEKLRAMLGADAVPQGQFIFQPSALVGRYVRLRVEQRNDTSGNPDNDVKRVYPFGDDVPPPEPAAAKPKPTQRGGKGTLF